MIYSLLKDLYPVSIARKIRHEGKLIIATNSRLDLIYLNETASYFFNKLTGKKTVQNITNEIFNEYEVELYILQKDICHLIRDMQWNDIIKLSKSKK